MVQYRRRPVKSFRQYAAEYLNDEKSAVLQKSHALFNIALVYPNTYEVGMSNLGYQTLYYLINENQDTSCERIFAYPSPFEKSIKTLESGSPLSDFDIVAFSISFELDYINVLEILQKAGIALFWKDRSRFDPIVLAGGAAITINPTPMMPIMDVLFIGEAEQRIADIIDVLRRADELDAGRAGRLDMMGTVAGVLVPATVHTRARDPAVVRQYVPDIRTFPTYSKIVSPKTHYKNTFLIEVGRGCARGCSFCAAGHLYRPLRLRSVDEVLQTVSDNIFATTKVGLMGAALSDFRGIDRLCEQLADSGYQLGLSSFRFELLTNKLLTSLVAGGVRTVSVAPETGSERLRFHINKRITDEEILSSLRLLSSSSINNLRLYFMIGIPGEDQTDLVAIVKLVKEVSRIFIKKAQQRTIKISINAMIPKPWTVFQWAAMEEKKVLQQKRAFLHEKLKKIPGVKMVPKSVKQEILQGLFSLGDERVAKALVYKVRDNISWDRAMERAEVSWERVAGRQKQWEDILPWDMVDTMINRSQLMLLWKKVMG